MIDFYCIEDLKYDCRDTTYSCNATFSSAEWRLSNNYSTNTRTIFTNVEEVTFSPYSYMSSNNIFDTTNHVYSIGCTVNNYYISNTINYNLLDMELLQNLSFTGNYLNCGYFYHNSSGHDTRNVLVDITPTKQGFMFYEDLTGRPDVYYAQDSIEFSNYSTIAKLHSIIVDEYTTADSVLYYKGSGGIVRLSDNYNRGYLRLPIGEDSKVYNIESVLTDSNGEYIYYALNDNVSKPVNSSNVELTKTELFSEFDTDKDWIATNDLVRKITRHTITIDGIKVWE